MANFWDKLSANVTNVSRQGIQKAKNLSEASALSNEQRTEKKNIQVQFAEIGRLYYEKYKDAADAEFTDQISSIIASERRVAELEEEIAAVRAREPELVDVPEYEPPTPAAAAPQKKDATSMYCIQCGSSYGVSEKFCAICGSELVPQYGGAPNVRTTPGSLQPVASEEDAAESEKPDTLDFLIDEDAAEDTQDTPDAENAADAPAEEEKKAENCFCPYCGKPCQTDMAFCPGCGRKL